MSDRCLSFRPRQGALRAGQSPLTRAERETPQMSRLVQDIIIEAIEEIRPLVEKIERRDRDLAKQIRTAASSVALNHAEGEWGRKGHRPERLSTAMNSAKEARNALRVAAAWRYVTLEETDRARDKLDHVAACLWRIIHA